MQKLYFIIFVVFINADIHAQINIDDLDTYIEHARKQWEVPGLSIAIVKDGTTMLSKGYGVRSISDRIPVDEHTMFMLGSTTKAMTATAMAMLVDEGKIDWEDRVIDHLPWFRLKDPYITRELRIRDLFTHNSGLGNADLLWVLWDYSTEEIVKRLAYLDASYSMRGGYTYQNIMYATAGLIIEKVSGVKWPDFIHERIFNPIGMTQSCALKSCAEQKENKSTPHYPTSDGIIEIIDSNADSIGAAGSAWSCADDITKWMNFVLDSTVVNGKRLVSKKNFYELHRPHIIIPKRQFYPTTQLTQPIWTSYSLGWFQHDYAGEYVQFHTGSLNGSGAIIGLLPKHKIGVYVMVNLDHAEVRHALMYKVFDYLLELGDRDWSSEVQDLYATRGASSERQRQSMIKARKLNTINSIHVDDLLGTYANEWLGELTINYKEGTLTINCRLDRHISLEHWQDDTYLGKIVEYKHDQGSLIDFNQDAQGRISFSLYGHNFRKQ